MDGLPLVDHEVVPIAKMMDLLVTENVVVARAPVLVAIVLGFQTVGLVVVLIAKTMDLPASENVVVVRVPAPVVRREPHVIGTAVVELVEENGKHPARIQAASFHGALQNACRITQRLEQSAIPQVHLFMPRQLQEIPSGKMALAVASVSCSLLRRVGR